MVAVVVSDQGRCGIDVERAGRVSDTITTARAFFSPAEQALLMAAAPADRDRIFAAHWALKEAWAKAMGRGLDLPVQRVGFELRQDGRVTMSLPPALGTAADWHLELHHPTPDHVLAVALDRAPQQPVALGWCQTSCRRQRRKPHRNGDIWRSADRRSTVRTT